MDGPGGEIFQSGDDGITVGGIVDDGLQIGASFDGKGPCLQRSGKKDQHGYHGTAIIKKRRSKHHR